MNILVLGTFHLDSFATHIAETLESMGHVVRQYTPMRQRDLPSNQILKRVGQILETAYHLSDNLPAIRSKRIRSLWKEVERGPVDLSLVCYDFLWPEEVKELKRLSKAPVAMWFPDSIAGFRKSFFMNADYDALFFKDPFILHQLGSNLSSPVYYLPECFNPEKHRLPEGYDLSDPKYACDITTAGNMHPWRHSYFKHTSNYDVKIWGYLPPLWMNVGPVAPMLQKEGVYNEEKAKAFRCAKVLLNNLHCSEVWGVNARFFEAAGIGAFQMVDWRPGLAHLLEDGKEVVSFRSIADMKEKLEYWLPREEERHAIGAAAHRRCLQEHTYRIRLELLLETVAGRAKGFEIPDMNL